MRFISCSLIAATALLFASCTEKGPGTGKSRGPITLGDSATIVTETDSAYLRDAVVDINTIEQSSTPAAPATDTAMPAETPAAETPAAETPQTATPAPGGGFSVDFGDVQVFLPAVPVQGGEKNVKGKSSAAYSLQSGGLPQGTLTVRNGTVTRVQQRISTGVAATHNGTTLYLSGLPTSNGAWQNLQSSGAGQYRLLPVSNLSYSGNANAASIRNAVQRAAQGKRLPAKDVQAWVAAVKNTGRAGAAPTQVVARAATWKIEGKATNGKSFSKEIRMDIPM